MNNRNKILVPTSMVLALGVLSGCDPGGDNVSSIDPVVRGSSASPATVIEKQVDATAGGRGAAPGDAVNKYTYFDLDNGEVVNLTDVQAKTNLEWDVAFKRTNFKLNGGVSGEGTVEGSVADAQDEFYDAAGDPVNSVFINASAGSELESFNAISDFSDLSFEKDRNIPYIKGDGSSAGWWLYSGEPSYAVSANADKWWLVKSAAAKNDVNSYAKFHVTDIVQASRDITLELFIQGVSDDVFPTTPTTWTANIGAAGGSKCYDIDAAAEVACSTSATDWDIKVEVVGQKWNIWTNGGVSGSGTGAAFGPFDSTEEVDYVSGTVNSAGTSLSRMYGRDSAGGVFKDNSWYAYNLQENNKLWPNYRVYAIDTGTAKFKFQVLSFYDDAGASGWIKFRYVGL